jgi:type IV secretion system protein VirD4
VRGVRPFLSAKYDITKHPRYKYLSDADKRNAFDVEKCLARVRRPQPPVKSDEVFGYYEIEG